MDNFQGGVWFEVFPAGMGGRDCSNDAVSEGASLTSNFVSSGLEAAKSATEGVASKAGLGVSRVKILHQAPTCAECQSRQRLKAPGSWPPYTLRRQTVL